MQRVVRILLLLLLLTIAGTAWFNLVEGWSTIDSLYMTVITLTTVGYREVGEPSDASKLFIIVFLIIGIGIFMYGVVEIGELVVRAELRQWWRKRNMHQELKNLSNHFIVCGFGRMGQMVCQDLATRGVSFVAIERDRESLEDCEERGWPVIEGDATDDRSLHEAGVLRAAGLAAVLSSDADNLFVVLSAKLIVPKIRVIARAYDERGTAKLKRAGADHVVSLYASGASRISQLLTNPQLGNFFEVVAEGGLKLDLAEIPIDAGDQFVGKSLSETNFRERGIIVVGIRQSNGKILVPPSADTAICEGDHLFALGTSDAIRRL